MWRVLIIFVLATSSLLAQEQSTAYDALKVVGTHNRAALRRIVSVTGVDGDPQPATWRVTIADRTAPGGMREFDVADGRIVSERTPTRNIVGTTEGATIDTAQLNLDSSGAFTVASYTADKSHTTFSLVSYTLRTNDRGVPVWIVTVQDESRRPLGTIHIGANKGNVTRVEGMYHGAEMAQVEEDRVDRNPPEDEEVAPEATDEENDGDENIVKVEIKRMFYRTKRDAQRLFVRARRSFDHFINRE